MDITHIIQTYGYPGLRVIGCFGETLEERKAGLAVSVIKRQVLLIRLYNSTKYNQNNQ